MLVTLDTLEMDVNVLVSYKHPDVTTCQKIISVRSLPSISYMSLKSCMCGTWKCFLCLYKQINHGYIWILHGIKTEKTQNPTCFYPLYLTGSNIPGGYISCSFLHIDLNECTLGTHNCHPTLANCTNTPGSFRCQCKAGFNGDGVNCTGKCMINLKCEHDQRQIYT